MHTKVKNLCYIALFAALIAVCTWITVPGTVPFTMQTFAVMVAVGLLGTGRGLASVALYLALGLCGVPVFSGFRGGVGVLAGTTGGYLVGFLFAALVTGLLIRAFGSSAVSLFLSMCAGVAVCYLFGTVWYMVLTGTGLWQSLTVCVFPFLIGDALKILLAAFLTKRLKPVLKL